MLRSNIRSGTGNVHFDTELLFLMTPWLPLGGNDAKDLLRRIPSLFLTSLPRQLIRHIVEPRADERLLVTKGFSGLEMIARQAHRRRNPLSGHHLSTAADP